MKTVLMLAGVLLLLTTVGCSTGPKPIPRMDIPENTSFTADFSTTWNAVLDVLTATEMPTKTLEKESGFVATEFVSSGRRWAYLGMENEGKELSQWAVKTRYFLNIRVKATDGGATTVKVTPHIEYMSYRWMKGVGSVEAGWKACWSHGDIERDFYEALRLKLAN